MPAHTEMLQQLLRGIDVEEGGTVVVLDILPNETFAWRLFFQVLHIAVARLFREFDALLQIISSYYYNGSLTFTIWNCPRLGS